MRIMKSSKPGSSQGNQSWVVAQRQVLFSSPGVDARRVDQSRAKLSLRCWRSGVLMQKRRTALSKVAQTWPTGAQCPGEIIRLLQTETLSCLWPRRARRFKRAGRRRSMSTVRSKLYRRHTPFYSTPASTQGPGFNGVRNPPPSCPRVAVCSNCSGGRASLVGLSG